MGTDALLLADIRGKLSHRVTLIMRSHRCLLPCGWLLALALACVSSFAVSARAAGPPSTWKIADTFPLSVEVYPRAANAGKASAEKEPVPSASFVMHAALLPVLPFEECGCWKLQFLSFSKQPEFTEPYRVWIDKNTGQTRKASRFVGPKEMPLPSADIAAMILDAPAGYPVEVIPDIEAATIPTKREGTTVDVSSRTVDGASERKAIVRINGKVEIEIRQRWQPGAKWWSDYERLYRGQRDLVAHPLTPPTKPAPVTPRPAPTPEKTPPAPDDFRSDPRLQVPISADLHHRPLQELLDLLSQQTSVELTMEAALAATVPSFGGTNLRNVPAWKVMEQIARDFVEEGRWDKAGTGYQLSARVAVQPRRPPDPSRSFLMWWLAGGLGILVFAAVWHWLRRTAPPSSPSALDAGKPEAR